MKGQWNAIFFKFLVNGDVKPEPFGRSYGSISFVPREELIVFACQMQKPQFLSVVQSPFDNCNSPCSFVHMQTYICNVFKNWRGEIKNIY